MLLYNTLKVSAKIYWISYCLFTSFVLFVSWVGVSVMYKICCATSVLDLRKWHIYRKVLVSQTVNWLLVKFFLRSLFKPIFKLLVPFLVSGLISKRSICWSEQVVTEWMSVDGLYYHHYYHYHYHSFFEKITNLVHYSHIFCNGYFHVKRHFRYILLFVITQKHTTLAKKASLYKRTKAKTANFLVLLLLRLWIAYILYFTMRPCT